MFKKILIITALFGAVVASTGTEAKAWTSFGTCYATTTCYGPWGPYQISCSVTADSYRGVACSWFVIPGRYVECRGITAEGLWGRLFYQCY